MADAYLRYNGFTYDPRILGVPIEVVGLRERLAEDKNAGNLALGLAVESLERILNDRQRGHHALARTHEADQVCVCGLVVGPGIDMSRAQGHLDQKRWISEDRHVTHSPPEYLAIDHEPAAAMTP